MPGKQADSPHSIPDCNSGRDGLWHGVNLTAALESIVSAPVRGWDCVPLRGDASTRQYFRIRFQISVTGGESRESLILMRLEQPVVNGKPDFIPVREFLHSLDLPVPHLFLYDAENGLLYLEDCGDLTLEEKIRSANEEETRVCYREAVDLLAALHDRATKKNHPGCPAHGLSFDVDKLMWEFEFMLEHFLRGLRRVSLSGKETEDLCRAFRPLCETLAAQPRVFTHRDYHSRNLMVHGGRLVMLDFQDARMGPCQYDLVSLLKDSYVTLKEDLVNEMAERYITFKERCENTPVNRESFLSLFDWMALQRNLKAVGTFSYQSAVKGNRRYLDHIPPALECVRLTLDRRPELAPLRQVLAAHIPELDG